METKTIIFDIKKVDFKDVLVYIKTNVMKKAKINTHFEIPIKVIDCDEPVKLFCEEEFINETD